jgi:hypothetical protein
MFLTFITVFQSHFITNIVSTALISVVSFVTGLAVLY